MRSLCVYLLPLMAVTFGASCAPEAKKRGGLASNRRVARAIDNRRAHLKALFEKKGLEYPNRRVFIRIFKRENILELWGQRRDGQRYVKVETYPICYASGSLGPKRRQGDRQVPEGFYHVRVFNPFSKFHLSLGINYPNRSDQILGHKRNLGSAIMIHGDCVSIGCVAITDAKIEEVFLAAVEARRRSRQRIPVHIFPTRLDRAGMAWLRKQHASQPKLLKFWSGLAPGFEYFERSRTLPRIRVDRRGAYRISGPRARRASASAAAAM